MRYFMYLVHKLFKKLRLSGVINSKISCDSKVESGTSFYHSSIDRNSFCGYDCEIFNTKIGKFCSIANCVAIGGGEHPINWASTSPVFYNNRDSIKVKYSAHDRPIIRGTIIGNDVWIGRNSIIKQGITIGDGAVIGMGAVVVKNVPPYAIVGGVPAKIIGHRFSEKQIEKLLALQWWNLNDLELTILGKHIKNINIFIEKLESLRGSDEV